MTLRRTRAVAFYAPSSNRAADSNTPSKSLDTSMLCPQPARAKSRPTRSSVHSSSSHCQWQLTPRRCKRGAKSRAKRTVTELRRLKPLRPAPEAAVALMSAGSTASGNVVNRDGSCSRGTGSRLTLNAISSARRAHLLPPGHTAPDPHSRCGCAAPACRKAREL
jgi:hypothetical protein